jgi:hypothetical protein
MLEHICILCDDIVESEILHLLSLANPIYGAHY